MQLSVILTAMFLAASLSFAQSSEPNNTNQLDYYLEYAALNNKMLEAAYNQWQADLERVPQAKSLDDPIIEYNHYIIRMQDRQSIGISQAIPWFGKLKLRGDVAAKKALGSYYKYLNAHLELNYNLRKAYYDYYYIGKSIEITRENIELLESLERNVIEKYRSSQSTQTDIVKVQVEIAKLKDKLKELNDILKPKAALINSLLNRPASSEIPMPEEIEMLEIDLSEKQLINFAAVDNPEIKMLEADIQASESNISLAKKAYYPDFRFGIGVMDMKSSSMSDDDKDPVMVGVMLNIPIWKEKNSARLREARNRYFASSNRKLDKINRLYAQVSEGLYDYNNAQRKIELYSKSLLNLANQSLNLEQAAFRAGSGSLISIIDSQRLLLELELSYQKALTDKAVAASKLDMLCGGVLRSKISKGAENE